MKLFRLMKVDGDGKPLVGTASMRLGVRPTDPANPKKRADVAAVITTDPVLPHGGGLSCYTDPDEIRIKFNELSLWSIDTAELQVTLISRADNDSHYLIEPGWEMSLGEFQCELAKTRDLWNLETE